MDENQLINLKKSIMNFKQLENLIKSGAEEITLRCDVILEDAEKKIVLRRSPEDILNYIGNFVVAEIDGKVCGCGAARDFGNELYEIRSLVVNPAIQKMGVGKAIVSFFVERMKVQKKINWKLFALTMTPGFFISLGFKEVEKEMFPEKIWADCLKCAKYSWCDETAVLLSSDV